MFMVPNKISLITSMLAVMAMVLVTVIAITMAMVMMMIMAMVVTMEAAIMVIRHHIPEETELFKNNSSYSYTIKSTYVIIKNSCHNRVYIYCNIYAP